MCYSSPAAYTPPLRSCSWSFDFAQVPMPEGPEDFRDAVPSAAFNLRVSEGGRWDVRNLPRRGRGTLYAGSGGRNLFSASRQNQIRCPQVLCFPPCDVLIIFRTDSSKRSGRCRILFSARLSPCPRCCVKLLHRSPTSTTAMVSCTDLTGPDRGGEAPTGGAVIVGS